MHNDETIAEPWGGGATSIAEPWRRGCYFTRMGRRNPRRNPDNILHMDKYPRPKFSARSTNGLGRGERDQISWFSISLYKQCAMTNCLYQWHELMQTSSVFTTMLLAASKPKCLLSSWHSSDVTLVTAKKSASSSLSESGRWLAMRAGPVVASRTHHQRHLLSV